MCKIIITILAGLHDTHVTIYCKSAIWKMKFSVAEVRTQTHQDCVSGDSQET